MSDSHEPSFHTQNVTLPAMLQFAYNLPESQMLNLPPVFGDKRFDIEAKADSLRAEMKTISDDEGKMRKRQMVQLLLKERFKLQLHQETRELPIYALVAAKGGPRLQPSKANGLTINCCNRHLQGEGMSTEQIARELARAVGRVVQNRTGILGRFDVELRWTPENEIMRAEADAPPSIFTALQEQLGLKLEPQKGPVEVIVVDHVEMPTVN